LLYFRELSGEANRNQENCKNSFTYTYCIFNNSPPPPENRAVYEIMWQKYGTARQAADDDIIRRMRFACWITKATDTFSEYVIIIVLPRQHWLRERPSSLRCMWIACLVCLCYCSLRPGKCRDVTCTTARLPVQFIIHV
jgi:hypothetical protein